MNVMKSQKTVKSRKCVLKCPDPIHIFSFPKDQIGRKVWLKQLGLTDAPKTQGVCNRHFSERMKSHEKAPHITQWAIPDINLPKPIYDDEDEVDFDDVAIFEEDDLSADYCMDEDIEIQEITVNGHSLKTDNNNSSEATGIDSQKEVAVTISPLDFEDMIDSQKPNSKDHKGVSTTDYSGFEEVFDDDDEVQSTTSEVAVQNRNGGMSEGDITSMPEPMEVNSTFKRKLIACVRRRRILYDPAHAFFGNVDKKTRAWERIGQILKLDGGACRDLWLNLRYNYQNHVRNLRQWLAGETKQRERPRIQFENDLIFLWRFIPDKCGSDDIDEISPAPSTETTQITSKDLEDEKPFADEPPPSSDDDNFVGNLIELMQFYPEMYDTNHANYGDAKRRSVIWEAVASELKEKATNCIFAWIQIQMRCELELKKKKKSYLVNKMQHIVRYILANETSPYKRSTQLKKEWVEPLYKCEEQHLLLAAMITNKRTRSYFANIDCPFATLYLLQISHWQTVAKARNLQPEQCEVTWIIVQMMYCELCEFRRNDCRLRDEWELENVITKLRDTVASSLPRDPPAESSKKATKTKPQPPQTPSQPAKMSKSPNIKHSSSFDELNDVEMLPQEDPQSLPPPQSPPQPTPSTPAVVPKSSSVQLPALQGPKNEVVFKIPPAGPGIPEKLVFYKLDTPISELPDTSVVDVDSVLPNAHIVITKSPKTKTGGGGDPKAHLFTMEKRQELIGEVMARPIIFNEPCKTSKVSRLFMSEISSEMKFPVEVCLAFWDYIVEKMLFVGYEPSWKKSPEAKWIPAPYPIFDKFIKFAETKNWRDNISILADFMQEIGNFPLIYSDLKINSSWNRRQCYIRDISEVWAILARKFVVLENHKSIWDKFKQIFLLYMSEIELSMYNPWPPMWAPVFSKMEFLLDFKYNPNKPIYHLLKIKIKEEIELCRQKSNGAAFGELDPVTNAKSIFRLLKENEYLEDFTWVNRARFISKMKSFPMLYDISHPKFGNKEAKLDAWQEMALLFHCTVGECHLIFQHLMKSFLIFRARDPNQICRVNAKYWENMTYIYSSAVPNSIDPSTISGRSFRSSSNGSTIKLAEEFQAEISMVDAKPRLILKNFASAINSLPTQLQSSVTQHLKYVLSEYTRIQNEEIIVDV